MILQHKYGDSDEKIVQAWIENPYGKPFAAMIFCSWTSNLFDEMAAKGWS